MRLAEQRARDWALAIGGGLLLAGALVMWLRPDSLGSTTAPPSGDVARPTSLPPAAMSTTTASPAPSPVASAGAPVADLQLYGLIQRPGRAAAIIGHAGRQRLVRVGAPVAPGLTLARVTPKAAIMSGPQGEVVLGFPGDQVTATGSAPPASANAWRLALQPLQGGSTITGWRIVDVAPVPILAAAGLRAGDIITDINGEALFSEEKILDLPRELASNPGATIGFRRGSRTLSARTDRPPA